LAQTKKGLERANVGRAQTKPVKGIERATVGIFQDAKLLTLQSPGGLLQAMNTDSKVLFHENTESIRTLISDTNRFVDRYPPNNSRPGQRSCSWTIQMKPQNLQKSLCGEMKKSPKFLDFCIILEIHVLASILHYQVLRIKMFSYIMHVFYFIVFTMLSHTSISHFIL